MSRANLQAVFKRLIRYVLILSAVFDDDYVKESGGYRVTFVA